jgi:hypothetical protein
MRPVLGTSCIFDSLQLADTPSELERKVQSKYYLFNDTKWHLFNISYNSLVTVYRYLDGQ